jgi:hypothetical protein
MYLEEMTVAELVALLASLYEKEKIIKKIIKQKQDETMR